jgi:hypothetical protein
MARGTFGIARLRPEQETAMLALLAGRDALAALPTGKESPLAKLPGTHFARWVIVQHIDPDSEYLLFSAVYDDGPRGYLEEICARIRRQADAIWGHCDRYPGTADREEFVRYMERHRVKTNLFVAAYPDSPLHEVREALALRQRLIAFAPRAQSMTPQELQEGFRDEVLARLPERRVAVSG